MLAEVEGGESKATPSKCLTQALKRYVSTYRVSGVYRTSRPLLPWYFREEIRSVSPDSG
jgi:hypothetical protein